MSIASPTRAPPASTPSIRRPCARPTAPRSSPASMRAGTASSTTWRATPPATACPTTTSSCRRSATNGACRQVAHGQQRRSAAGLRHLDQLQGPRQALRPRVQRERKIRPAQGLHHRPAERARGRVHREEARQAIRAVPRAQGGPSRRLPGRRRHARPDAARRLQGGRAAQGPVQGQGVPAAPQRAALRQGGGAEAGLGRGVRAEEDRALAGPTSGRSTPASRRRSGCARR